MSTTNPINKNWHHKHKLALNAPLEVRTAWHLEHQKHCACRAMPSWMVKKLAAQIQQDKRP
jgi:hypothetical protein